MAIQLNVSRFKDLMKRGTVNHAIENVKMVFTREQAVSAMRGTNLISIVKWPNNILTGLKKADEIDFCFVNPVTEVLPYLEILRGEMVDTKIESGYIELKEDPYLVKINLKHPNVVTAFDIDRKPNINFFVDFHLTEEFLNFLSKTKGVSSSTGMIFMGVKDGFLYARAGGAQNELNSEINLNLVPAEFRDIELSFNFKSFTSMVSLIDTNFTLSCAYEEEQELGLIRAVNEGESETYFIMSQI